jgi:hypothetical protein
MVMKILDEQILAREMTRKQFLQYMGAATIAVLGIGNLLAVLTSIKEQPEASLPANQLSEAKKGFGTRKFGV